MSKLFSDGRTSINVERVASHRNGIGGRPFYVVLFRDPQAGNGDDLMVGIVYAFERGEKEWSGEVAVLDVPETLKLNIEFAEGNSWRGDSYEAPLRAAVKAYENRCSRLSGSSGLDALRKAGVF